MPKSNYKPNERTKSKPREPMTAADVAHNTRMRTDVQLGWIRKLKDSGRGMTEWEQGFVESVRDALSYGSRLSERQAETLERIYCDRTN